MGFHHTAREVWMVDVMNKISGKVEEHAIVCDGSGEDPTCHDGACLLGLCTSFADHLLYLDQHMYHNALEC